MDIFGIEREKKIIESGVRNIFTPYQPIMSDGLFFGRASEVSRIIQQLNTPGQYSILFGDRGVGKSSLANFSSDLILGIIAGGKLIKKRCDSHDTFQSIIEPLLNDVGINIQIKSTQAQKAEGGNAGVDIKLFKAGIDTKTTTTENMDGLESKANSPSWVAQQIKGIKGLFLLDEIDIVAKEEKWKVAELIKQLSDEGSSLKFLVVGIAETAEELTNGHPSVQRCLKETPLKKMSNAELREILDNGESKLNISFTEGAKRWIVKVSSGYPHFTHLLALKSAEQAIGESRASISIHHIVAATEDAAGDSEGTLKAKYNNSTRSSNTDEFKKILLAAANCNTEEITAKQLRNEYNTLWGKPINQGWLNNYLQKIVSEDETNIIRRVAKGVYKFTDPRMPSYIKLINLAMLSPETESD